MNETNKELVRLEEMDWKNAERIAKEQIRKNLMELDINYDILNKSRFRLKEMYNALPAEEKEKRKKNEDSSN